MTKTLRSVIFTKSENTIQPLSVESAEQLESVIAQKRTPSYLAFLMKYQAIVPKDIGQTITQTIVKQLYFKSKQ